MVNTKIQRIVEGFFGSQRTHKKNEPVFNIDEYKEDLKKRLLAGNTVAPDEWDFINKFMDKYVPVQTKAELMMVVHSSITAYGWDVPLNWLNTSSVTNMSYVFESNMAHSVFDVEQIKEPSFKGDVSRWDVSRVTDMSGMFSGCFEFNSDLSSWDVSSVIYMSGMFHGCRKFEQDLSKWDVSRVKNMSLMFCGCASLLCNLSSWNVKDGVNAYNMFLDCPLPEGFRPKFMR